MGLRNIFTRVFSRSSEPEWATSPSFEPYTPGQVTKTFTATVADEISVPRGSTVKALYRDDQWIYVQVEDGRRGFVPHAYCRLASSQNDHHSHSNSKTMGRPHKGKKGSHIPSSTLDRKWEKTNLQRFIDSLPIQKEEGEPFDTTEKGEATVLFDFHAEAVDDLEARENEKVTILNCSDPEWTYCRIDPNHYGFIPTSHLKMPSLPIPKSTPSSSSSSNGRRDKWENENLLVIESYTARCPIDLTVRPGEWVKCLGGMGVDDWVWAQRLSDEKKGFIPCRIVILATDL